MSMIKAKVVFATDEWFGEADNLVNQHSPEEYHEYCDTGKLMDGWETQRKTEEGYDYCILKLESSSIIESFVVDTSYFTGNFAPNISIGNSL